MSSTVTGEGAKASGAGYIVGYALEPLASGNGTIKVLVRPQYYTPSNISVLEGDSLNITGAAQINGNLSVGSQLNVTGPTTLTDLTVTGDAVFTGNLTVQNISVANITINGHVITAGNAPTVAVGAAAGVADIPNSIAAPSVTITGNDTSGTITVVAGANTTADELAKVTFNTAFGAKPKVVFTAANRDSTKLGAYYDESTTSTTGFSILTDNAPQAGKVYTFTYFIVQ
jgi:hypothetical protein